MSDTRDKVRELADTLRRIVDGNTPSATIDAHCDRAAMLIRELSRGMTDVEREAAIAGGARCGLCGEPGHIAEDHYDQ